MQDNKKPQRIFDIFSIIQESDVYLVWSSSSSEILSINEYLSAKKFYNIMTPNQQRNDEGLSLIAMEKICLHLIARQTDITVRKYLLCKWFFI